MNIVELTIKESCSKKINEIITNYDNKLNYKLRISYISGYFITILITHGAKYSHFRSLYYDGYYDIFINKLNKDAIIHFTFNKLPPPLIK